MLSILFDTSIDTLVKGDVTVMEEAVERDRKRMGAQMQWLAVLMLGLLALTLVLMLTPAFGWMEGIWGTEMSYVIAVLPAVAGLVVAAVIDNIKRKNDLVTYKEILAFMNGEADIERSPRALPPPWLGSASSFGLRHAHVPRCRRDWRSTRLPSLGAAALADVRTRASGV